MIYITRRECFSSAHRLFNPAYSDEKNFETYGKCSNAGFHGHNYVMYVTVKGDVNPETGMVMNMKMLGDIEVITKKTSVKYPSAEKSSLNTPMSIFCKTG